MGSFDIKKNFKKLKIWIFLISCSFTFIISMSYFFYDISNLKVSIKKELINNAINTSEKKEILLDNYIKKINKILYAVNESFIFKEYQNNEKKDSLKHLEKYFFNITLMHENIMQLRYIDKNGKETIRVQRNKIEEPPIFIKKNKLQDKSNRYYFKDSIKKDYNKIWLSELDLNIENGILERPFNSTLRVILPVSKENNFSGILIINYFFNDFLESFLHDNYYSIRLFNDKKEILTSFNKSEEWSAFTKNGINLENLFPSQYKSILKNDITINENYIIKKMTKIKTPSKIFAYYGIKESYLDSIYSDNIKGLFIKTTILLIISIFFAYLLSKIVGNLLLNYNKEIEKQNKKLILATESSNTVIFEIDINSKKLISNDQIYHLFELKKEKNENLFHKWKKLLNNKDFKKIEMLFKNSVKDKLPFNLEYKVITPLNNKKYFRSTGLVIEENGIKKLLITNIDITEIIRYNNELEEKKDELEKAISEIKYQIEIKEQALEEAKVSEEEAIAAQEELIISQDQLIYANNAKSEFLSNMSHEIRTPLNGIIGIINIILEEKPEKDKLYDYLETTKISLDTLKDIINDILDFSKIQSGKFQIDLKPFSLNELILNIDKLFRSQINRKGLIFELKLDDELDYILIGDSLRLTQILNNLIGNAIKFTEKGRIELEVKKIRKIKDKIDIKFIISDTGIGISQELQRTIFNSFEQGELANTKEYQGTGLGLSIVQSLIELMNSRINIVSYEGIGSKFYFTLSFKISNDKSYIKDIKNSSSEEELVLVKPKKALLVEDSNINQLVGKKILEKIGFIIDIANV